MSKKVLVVDDDKNIVELLNVNLTHAGFSVVVAYDGMQAVSMAHKQKPDLLVLDIMLPAGGGDTVIDRLKLSADTATIPVIAISALPFDQIKQRMKGKVLAAVFPKPLDVDLIVKKVSELLA